MSQSNTALGTGEVVTLYSDNYLRWYKSETIETVNRTRLDIAKDTVTNLIESAPSVDFGLQVFNYDYPNEGDRDGGRIVFGIQESTATARAELVEIIDLEIDGETNTPLCESLYEAMRYLGGESVIYGKRTQTMAVVIKAIPRLGILPLKAQEIIFHLILVVVTRFILS